MFDLLMLAIAFFAGWVMIPPPTWADEVREKIISYFKNLFKTNNND